MTLPIWEDRDWQPLPRLEGPARADVCVIGLGGSGLAAMEELGALGVSAIGVEAGEGGAGAAGRNGGFMLAGLARFFNETVVQFGEATASALSQEFVSVMQPRVHAPVARRYGVLWLDEGAPAAANHLSGGCRG